MAKQKKKAVKKTAPRKPASPAGAAEKFMKDLSAKAELLHKKRRMIDSLKEKHHRETEDLFAEISSLKAEVLSGLKIIGLSQVKVRGGASYYISKTHGFEIKNPIAMERWAFDRRLVRPDKDLVKQELKKLAEKENLPEFAVPVEGETISYRSNKKPEDGKKKS